MLNSKILHNEEDVGARGGKYALRVNLGCATCGPSLLSDSLVRSTTNLYTTRGSQERVWVGFKLVNSFSLQPNSQAAKNR